MFLSVLNLGSDCNFESEITWINSDVGWLNDFIKNWGREGDDFKQMVMMSLRKDVSRRKVSNSV